LSQAVLKGDLGRFQPAEVLQFLQLAQVSGRLELSRLATGAAGAQGAEETVDVFFVHGRPVFARTSAQSVRTGEILVHRGHATHEAVVGALEAQRRGAGKRIGEMLAERHAVAPVLVVQAVHECVLRVLYGMLLWREGRFRFFADEQALDDDLPLDLDLDRLILEGLRLADQARAERQ
jgi:hypothetical protein